MMTVKETKNDGWVKLYSTDFDEDGNVYYVVECGKDSFPAHQRTEYESESEAVEAYRNAK